MDPEDIQSGLDRQAAELRQRQDELAQQSTKVTSEDGLVTARVDASGTVQEVQLSPKAFERSRPEQLARTITSVVREASGRANQAMRAQFEPMTEDMPDLSDILPGAPSFKELFGGGLGEAPDPDAERAQRASERTPATERRSRKNDSGWLR